MKEWILYHWKLLVLALASVALLVVITLVDLRILENNPPSSKATQLCLENTKDLIDIDLRAAKAQTVPIGSTARSSIPGTLVVWDLEGGGKVECTCQHHNGNHKLVKLLYNGSDLTELLRQSKR